MLVVMHDAHGSVTGYSMWRSVHAAARTSSDANLPQQIRPQQQLYMVHHRQLLQRRGPQVSSQDTPVDM